MHYHCCIQLYFGIVWMVLAHKKVLVTPFLCIFHVKTKWNIVYENFKTKILSRDTNILLQMYWTSNTFLDPRLQALGVLEYHWTIQPLTSRKRYAKKTSGCGTDYSCLFFKFLLDYYQQIYDLKNKAHRFMAWNFHLHSTKEKIVAKFRS